jgi:hypothetical protein
LALEDGHGLPIGDPQLELVRLAERATSHELRMLNTMGHAFDCTTDLAVGDFYEKPPPVPATVSAPQTRERVVHVRFDALTAASTSAWIGMTSSSRVTRRTFATMPFSPGRRLMAPEERCWAAGIDSRAIGAVDRPGRPSARPLVF